MGGSQNALRATALVFTFVAIWHDLAWHMLAWGWAVSIFIIPEMVARKWWPPKEASPFFLHFIESDDPGLLWASHYNSTRARPGIDTCQPRVACSTLCCLWSPTC